MPSLLVTSVMIRTVRGAVMKYALRALRTSLESVYSRFGEAANLGKDARVFPFGSIRWMRLFAQISVSVLT